MAAAPKKAMHMGFEIDDLVGLDNAVEDMTKAHDEAMSALAERCPLEYAALASVLTSLMGVQTAILATRLSELNETMMAQYDVLVLLSDRLGVKIKPNGTIH